MRFVVTIVCLLAALLAAAPVHAGQATCSNPGIPVGAAASSDLLPGRLTLNLTVGMLPIHSEQVLDDGARQVRYDASLLVVESRLAGELALKSWLAVGVALPFRSVAVDVTYRDPASGDEVGPGSAGIHARDETLRGIADPSLHLHLARELGAFRLHARIGTSLPLGSTVDNPFVLGNIGQEHQHVQFGSGTLIPFVAVEAQRAVGVVTLAAWALAHVSLYENDHGFRASTRISGGLSGSSSLGMRAWTFGLAAELHAETAETWDGVVYREEGNAGRRDVLVGGSVAWRPTSRFAVIADLKVPAYSEVIGSQLDYSIVAGIGLVGTFDLGQRASWRGLDQASVGPAGTAPALVPVAARITVFDLWADWCAPCRELDDKLVALARRYPDRIAVRKLDVVDNESAAWMRYLAPGQFSLPHIKVYKPDGTLLFERTASPDELVRAVEAVLR